MSDGMDSGRGRRRGRGVPDRGVQPAGPPAQRRARRLERHRRATEAPHRSRSQSGRDRQGYAAHERSLFEEIASRRAASVAASDVGGQANAERALSGSLGKLIAVAEAYPDLKANQNFLELQNQLAEIEDHIQMARRYYNGAVRNLNISIQSFPDVLVARTLGFREEPFFELESRAEAAAPQIGFPGGKA